MDKCVYISEYAYPEVREYLASVGRVCPVCFDPRLGRFTGDHADLRLIALGGELLRLPEKEFFPEYPKNAAFCAVALDGLLLHRLDLTSPVILEAAKKRGMRLVNCRQGYAKCSTVIVDPRSVITSDAGITAALAATGISVLTVAPGFVLLPGYPTGFIGGASGRVGDEIVFNGDLSNHPDHTRIRDFIEARGLRVRHFPGLPLRDIGSIIEL